MRANRRLSQLSSLIIKFGFVIFLFSSFGLNYLSKRIPYYLDWYYCNLIEQIWVFWDNNVCNMSKSTNIPFLKHKIAKGRLNCYLLFP
jgi:hypothetical protein